MDADFIAVKDMDPIVALLETHDFISYQMEGVPGSEGVSMMQNQKVSMIDSDRHRFGFCMCLTRICSNNCLHNPIPESNEKNQSGKTFQRSPILS